MMAPSSVEEPCSPRHRMGGRGSDRARGRLVRRRLALAAGRSFPAETALRVAAVACGLEAGRPRILHDSFARHRYRGTRAAVCSGVEPLGLFVERHRPHRRDRGGKGMTSKAGVVCAGGVRHCRRGRGSGDARRGAEGRTDGMRALPQPAACRFAAAATRDVGP